jgi:uncharacterized protein (DUF1330 family)
MAKGYIIARLEVLDPDAFKEYVNAAAIALKKHSVNVLVRGGRSESLEGENRARNVVLEFPSYDEALKYYHSPEYQAAKQHRIGISYADIVVVEGV